MQKYNSYHELAASESDGYRIKWVSRISNVLVITPHGGGIEPGSSEIVQALAGNEFSWYCFDGARTAGNETLHVTSTRFDEPIAIGLLSMANMVLTVHGCRSRRKIIFVGGLHTEWVQHFINSFYQTGFESERGEFNISGTSQRNICNRGKSRKGVQIELTEGLRRDLFQDLDIEGRKYPTPLFASLIQAGRKSIFEINQELQ